MLEWERGQDLSDLFIKENPIQKILLSGLYDAAIVGKNRDTGDGYTYAKTAKIVTVAKDGTLNTILDFPREQNLVKIIRGDDFSSEFDRISEDLLEHYFSPRIIYKIMDQIKKRELQIITAIILSENLKKRNERITIHYPKIFSDMVGEKGATILAANFLKLLPV